MTAVDILLIGFVCIVVSTVIYYTIKYSRMDITPITSDSSNYSKIVEEIKNGLCEYKEANGNFPDFGEEFDYLLLLKDLKLGNKHIISKTELHTSVNCIMDYYVFNYPVVKSYQTRNGGIDIDVVFYTFEELKNMKQK